LYYAKLSFRTAQSSGLPKSELEVYNFFTDYYKRKNIDSVFAYQAAAIAVKDSLFSRRKQRKYKALLSRKRCASS
jgi:hypothetical protein